MSEPVINDLIFWMIWTEEGRAPAVRYWSKREADKEALRLSQLHQGRIFYVLESKTAFLQNPNPIVRVEMTE